MTESIEVSEIFLVKPKDLYSAWLDSEKHSGFTGDKAEINPELEGNFTAGDGYITGKTIKLEPYRRIVQTWRTTEFPEESADSLLEILFEELKDGTKMVLRHSRIPEGQGQSYRQGWIDYYFSPMKQYFK